MRVLHCLREFSPLSETFIYHYITGLATHGVEGAVLTEERVLERERPFGTVYLVRRPKGRGMLYSRLAQPWGLLGGHRDHLEAIRAFRPDVLHAHYGHMGYRMAPVAAYAGVPLVTTFYGHDISQLLRRARWRWAYRSLARSGTAFTFLSNAMREDGLRAGFPAGRSHVVHLTADDAAFPFTAPSSKPCNGAVRVLSVGRLVPKKGFDDLICALALALRHGTDLNLTILGDGPLRPALDALCVREGVQDRVQFLGAQPASRVADEMTKAHLFALASKTAPDGDMEGTPTVLMEALMAGLPVCTTRHAGIPEILPESAQCWLSQEGDVAAFAAVLRDLAARRSEWDAIAKAGRLHVEREFSKTTQIPRLIQVYEHARAMRAKNQ